MGKVYAWKGKELYRLPFESGLRFYGLRKCKPWNSGYYLGQHRKSMEQLQGMTVDIDSFVQVIDDEDCPF